MTVSQICVILHYIITAYATIIFITIFQEFTIQMSFLAICYLFCRNSSKLLPQRKKYLKALKILGIIVFTVHFSVFLTETIFGAFTSKMIYSSCKTILYILLGMLGLPIQIVFLVAIFYIRKQIQNYQPQTEYEAAMHIL